MSASTLQGSDSSRRRSSGSFRLKKLDHVATLAQRARKLETRLERRASVHIHRLLFT